VKRLVGAPLHSLSGKHAGHVRRVEKGSRAVKALQRQHAGCTARWWTGDAGGTYLREQRVCERAGQRMAVMEGVRLKGAGIWLFFALVARGIGTRPDRALADESERRPCASWQLMCSRRTYRRSSSRQALPTETANPTAVACGGEGSGCCCCERGVK
jgi:hypothetical protein